MATSAEPAGPVQRDPRGPAVAYVVAVVLQACWLALAFVMGIAWAGLLWVATVVQTGAGLALIAWLRPRNTWWVLAVPLLSGAATLSLPWAQELYAEGMECSDAELAAVRNIEHPSGLEMEFRGEVENGCVARGYSSLAPTKVANHYGRELTREGWNVEAADQSLTARRDGRTLFVELVPQEGGLVLLTIR